ncbi:type I methionyl aminopeptidase [Geomesophilobacter sediminis]|uniref:Methionine aminopeptidase n=1 Tax=Geomesophilobacter sediminis TaxID=2798584 RepID=A0A8J7M0L6_9BACT|nr:type I methionyl aminopeptidase [Geomesophilobacter sediminis]MBJ6725832.1 type I methionyl aminopeptidase [Geomesophilobacter sediminis]
MIVLKSPAEIDKMRLPGRMVAEILAGLQEIVKPGVSLIELDQFAERETRKRKAVPAFKGYSGYPYSLCCSVNEQVVHGMPSERVLVTGDIVSLDYGVIYGGFYGDAAVTLPVGKISETATRLLAATRESLDAAIAAAIVGNRLSDISHAVQSYVEARGFSVVRDFVGHGIGKELHEGPQIPNFGAPGKGPKLRAGMVLAIEPMINEKGFDVRVLKDGWTAVTCDGGLSAHFEHTVAVTERGPQILTTL